MTKSDFRHPMNQVSNTAALVPISCSCASSYGRDSGTEGRREGRQEGRPARGGIPPWLWRSSSSYIEQVWADYAYHIVPPPPVFGPSAIPVRLALEKEKHRGCEQTNSIHDSMVRLAD